MKRAATIALTAGVLVTSAQPAAAYQRPGFTERISVAGDGTEGNNSSVRVEISADGRTVAFESLSENLIPGDTNGWVDIFVRDRVAGTTELVSVASDGTQANGASLLPGISADGRYVTFISHATNLVPGDTNGFADVFVHDRVAGTTERVSVSTAGAQPTGHSEYPVISGNGRIVVWESEATNIVPGDTNMRRDIFFRDRQTGTTGRASVATDGTQGNLDARIASITVDGRYVAFFSSAGNLVPNDGNRVWDVFVRDLVAGTTERVSLAGDGTEGNLDSINATISADGRYVAFYSEATNLVPQKTNLEPNPNDQTGERGLISVGDIYVRDRVAGTTERVSVSSLGAEGDDQSASRVVNDRPVISVDGRYVAFRSKATNLVPGDTNGTVEIFVHDRATRETERVMLAHDGSQSSNGGSAKPSMSADGRLIAFNSTDPSLVPGDANGMIDVFVRDRGVDRGVVGPLGVMNVAGGVRVSGQVTLSGVAVTGAADPSNDGGLAVRGLGAELTGAEIVRRPEPEDLLLRIRLAALPPTAAGLPGVLYGANLEVEGVPYEIRALRTTADDPLGGPHIALYRCLPACTRIAALPGAFGTTAPELLISVPDDLIGIAGGPTLAALRVFTALGEAGPGTIQPLDEVVLPSATVPVPRVELGIAPASVSEKDVAFEVSASSIEGSFLTTLDSSSLGSGPQRVWVRVCTGPACGPAVWEAIPG